MNLERILKRGAQAIALALAATLPVLAQPQAPAKAPAAASGVALRKAETLSVVPKAAPSKAAPTKVASAKAKNGDIHSGPKGKEVALLKSVEGNVLVSQASGLSSGDEAARLPEGSRVITTANSKAVVRYDDGCEVELKPNQRLEIDIDKPCKERIVQAHSILLEPGGMALAAGSAGATGGAAAAILGGSVATSAGLGVAGLTGMAALANARQENAASPN